jgi:xanthine dehydrogenase iron-sulfur cluster and FAD-binding subunit A
VCWLTCVLLELGRTKLSAAGRAELAAAAAAAAEAIAKHFASQCGYCTPGITVALAAAADRAAAEPAAAAEAAAASSGSRAAVIAAGLDGNLCRCTGWRPIIDVARVRRSSSTAAATAVMTAEVASAGETMLLLFSGCACCA